MEDQLPSGFADWIGRRTTSQDVISDRLVESFQAIFAPDLAPVPDGAAPLGIQWCLCPSIAPMAELGKDGHPALNRDLPPVPMRRRMWAGGSLEAVDALRVGDKVTRNSVIADISRKQGRSGELWFVAVDHEYATSRGPAIRERHHIVYRSEARAAAGQAVTGQTQRERHRALSVETPSTLLFRYSAISFNGHRIHYDLPYATDVEGYPGLVVHGPIQATLLLNLVALEQGTMPERFNYRAVSPAIAGTPLLVCAGTDGNGFWTQDESGGIKMEAWLS